MCSRGVFRLNNTETVTAADSLGACVYTDSLCVCDTHTHTHTEGCSVLVGTCECVCNALFDYQSRPPNELWVTERYTSKGGT